MRLSALSIDQSQLFRQYETRIQFLFVLLRGFHKGFTPRRVELER